jgi:hypothetical protein
MCSAVQLFLQAVPANTVQFIPSQAKLFYSLSVSSYQPSCQKCFHLVTVLNIVADKTVYSVINGWQSFGATSGQSAGCSKVYLVSKLYMQCKFILWPTFVNS